MHFMLVGENYEIFCNYSDDSRSLKNIMEIICLREMHFKFKTILNTICIRREEKLEFKIV